MSERICILLTLAALATGYLGRAYSSSLLTLTFSFQGVLEGAGNALLHRQQHAPIGVEGYGYGGATKHLRDDLGVDFAEENQGGASVSESWKRIGGSLTRFKSGLKERFVGLEGLMKVPLSVANTRPPGW